MQQSDFWQRRSARAFSRVPERSLHIAIADRLRIGCRSGWWWSTIPAGEFRTEKTGALLLRMGLRRGMADMLLIGPVGQHCWLEFKQPNGRLSDDQRSFAEMCRLRGIPHAIVRGYDQAVAQLKTWGAL